MEDMAYTGEYLFSGIVGIRALPGTSYCSADRIANFSGVGVFVQFQHGTIDKQYDKRSRVLDEVVYYYYYYYCRCLASAEASASGQAQGARYSWCSL